MIKYNSTNGNSPKHPIKKIIAHEVMIDDSDEQTIKDEDELYYIQELPYEYVLIEPTSGM